MRLSGFSVVVVARATVVLGCVVAERDTGVRVATDCVVARGVNILIGFALRGAAVVFMALREVVTRAFCVVVDVVVLPLSRDVAFFVRDAASAPNMQTAEIRIKTEFSSSLIQW